MTADNATATLVPLALPWACETCRGELLIVRASDSRGYVDAAVCTSCRIVSKLVITASTGSQP